MMEKNKFQKINRKKQQVTKCKLLSLVCAEYKIHDQKSPMEKIPTKKKQIMKKEKSK